MKIKKTKEDKNKDNNDEKYIYEDDNIDGGYKDEYVLMKKNKKRMKSPN